MSFYEGEANFWWGFARARTRALNEAEDTIDECNAEIRKQRRQIQELQKAYNEALSEIEELSNRLRLADMQLKGMEEQVKALIAQHLYSPLLADSGHKFKNGKSKNVLRRIFEAAFDRRGRELGITNPETMRRD